VVEPDRFEDERGYFTRTFVAEEFAERGLYLRVAQTAVSFNKSSGTLRGMHYQAEPHAQAKLVRCMRGAVYDVIIDLRPESPTVRKWVGVELCASDGRMLYVPAGFAHGFLTLEDATELCYHISSAYHPPAERGIRWDDPAFGIEWPLRPAVLAPRDARYADWSPAAAAS